jgi:glycosyltransferase involved in cell wall biosynthesis
MRPKICIVTTVSLSIKLFYPDQIRALQNAGFDVTVLCASDPELPALLPQGVRYLSVELTRSMNPWKDLKCLLQLWGIFRREQFAIIQYSTPKGSLLGALAAWLARCPIRIYILWGLYYIGTAGFNRWLLKTFEKIICRISTHILPISHDMIGFLESEGLAQRRKCRVMMHGSACGIDLDRVDPQKWSTQRDIIRNQYNIPKDAVVIGTVARLTGDKGINELVQAFDTISKSSPNAYLVLVGDQELKDRLQPATEHIIAQNARIRAVGWQNNPLPFYAAMDIFCLPTYREGFGEVNLEAQAMELPVVSTDTIGPRESVHNGMTGFLVKVTSSEALLEPLRTLIADPELRTRMGKAGRQRVREQFDRKDIVRAVVEHRQSLVQAAPCIK